jgi:hemerythrin-like domain-containing protein
MLIANGWAGRGMGRVLEALRREHESIESVLDVLESEIGDLTEFQGRRHADYDLVWRAIDYFTDFPDLVHHPKEDLIFARLRRINEDAARGIGDLPAAHATLSKELRDLATELKAVMDDPKRPRANLVAMARTFIQHQRRHLQMEEALFFPVAERVLDADAWQSLENEMTARLDPLIGGESGERFEALRRVIVSAVGETQMSKLH